MPQFHLVSPKRPLNKTTTNNNQKENPNKTNSEFLMPNSLQT